MQTTSLSIVATIYRTGQYIPEFVARSFTAAEKCGFSREQMEIVLVNDGCPANGLQDALNVKGQYPDLRIKIVDLSRNFGHHPAMFAGLRNASGELVFLLDGDLEEEPEWLEDFLATMRKEECDLVYGVQETRKGDFFEQLSGALFYDLFNAMSKHKVTKNMVVARLMTRRFVDAATSYPEHEPILFGIHALAGFKQCHCAICKKSTSPSSYTLRRRVALAINSILSFSARPLLYIALLGFFLTAGSVVFVLWLIFRAIFLSSPPEGWTSIVASIWFIGGITILCLGIISLYLAKIYEEVKRRPSVIIRRIYN